jgi:hypothetical protein
MKPSSKRPRPASADREVRGEICQALAHLLRAYDYARELGRDLWDFAVEIGSLCTAGVTPCDLRWLVCKGYVEQAVEVGGGGRRHRCFRRGNRLRFTGRACFVLTEEGVQLARAARLRTDPPSPPPERGPALTPRWDRACRELHLGPHVVKCFRQPAPDQETILAAFEEEGWPAAIDDPLPPRQDRDSRRHLNDTIKNLNRHQRRRLLRFRGAANGRGIRWQLDPAGYPGATPELP